MKTSKKQRVSRLFAPDIPIGESERIEITKRGGMRSILVEGIEGILLYGAEQMIFALKEGRLEIYGRELDCTTYVSGAIGITGDIRSLSFCGDGKE